MKQLFSRGKRIRPTDKDLVSHTALAALFPVFLLVVLLFHTGQIAGTNWQEVSLSQIIQDVNIPYLLFSMGVAGLVCLTAVLLFWRYRRDEVKQLIHRQKLARQVIFMAEQQIWVLCPVCNSKTRTKIRKDTELVNFPLFCPKCKKENLVTIKNGITTIIKEPDA